MRLFIAIPCSGEIKKEIMNIQEKMKLRGVRGNYIPEENLHLTLSFIGEYPDPDAVMDLLEEIPFLPVSLTLDGCGCFGDAWWIGLQENENLAYNARQIRRALGQKNITVDQKPFAPHITFLRKAVYQDIRQILEVPVPGITEDAEGIVLFKSDQGKKGMIYTELGFIPL